MKGRVDYLALNARFYTDAEKTQTSTKLLGLIEMGESSSGKALYEEINTFLFNDSQAEKLKGNLMGLVTDHAFNMISSKDAGLTNKFQAEIPHHLPVVHDLPHAYNLILRDAINTFSKAHTSIVSKYYELLQICYGLLRISTSYHGVSSTFRHFSNSESCRMQL